MSVQRTGFFWKKEYNEKTPGPGPGVFIVPCQDIQAVAGASSILRSE